MELASFRIYGVAKLWLDTVMADRSVDQQRLEWEEFRSLFLERFLPNSFRDAKAREFEEMRQGNKTVTKYVHEFNALLVYAPHLVPIEAMCVKRFTSKLRQSISKD